MNETTKFAQQSAAADIPLTNTIVNLVASGPGILGKLWILIIPTMVIISSCDSSDSRLVGGTGTNVPGGNDNSDDSNDYWLIPKNEVVDGGPGKDGIPSIDDPMYQSAFETDYVVDERLVVGVRIGGEVRAYPHQILDWHEIVNDHFGNKAVAIMHCPLTGTAQAWYRTIDDDETEFGVSGLLFRNNMIAYDRNTDSYWSQMQLRSVNGLHSGMIVNTYQVLETTWETWFEMYPDSEVITTETGFQRNYQTYAYGKSYLTNDDEIIFPVNNTDDRLNNKARVHGIIAESYNDEQPAVRVYLIDSFSTETELIEDQIDGRDYIIVGNSEKNFVAAFRKQLPDGSRPNLEAVNNELPVILQDDEGNVWDIFGVAVEGPREGQKFIPARSYTGYWFAWADFFPGLEIFGKE